MQAGDEILKLGDGPGGDDGRRGQRAALPPGSSAPASASRAANPRPQRRLAGVVPRVARRRRRAWQCWTCDVEPTPAWPGFRRLGGHGDREGERVGHLGSLRGSRRQAASRRSTRPVPHAPDPAGRGRAAAAAQLFALQARPMPATTGLLSSTSPTAPRAATCTPGSPSETSSKWPRRAAPSFSTSPMRPVLLISAGHRSHARPGDAQRAGGETLRSGDLVAARRTQPPRALVRSRDAGTARGVPEGACPRLLQPAWHGGPRRSRLRHGGPPALPRPCLNSSLRVTAEAYVCGPGRFMDEISAGLASIGLDASHIHTEPFGPEPGLTPGIASTPARTPHLPAGPARRRSHDRVRAQQPFRTVEQ